MAKVESLGIKRLEAVHYYVHDLARSRNFYVGTLDFAEVATSSADLMARGRQRSSLFQGGNVAVLVSEPNGEGGRAARWLKHHPDGVGALIFEVEDIHKTFKLLDSRGGTPISEVETIQDSLGTFHTFSITTPFGGATFRFVQRNEYRGIYPGMDRVMTDLSGTNRYGFAEMDHVTTNFETMSPALLWMEHVMGFSPFWNIEFHTEDVAEKRDTKSGSGLRSRVMWDENSGIKFANNEPLRPHFKSSQINIFYEQQRGDGIQHIAMTVEDMIPAVRGLRENGVEFMPTPGTYYEMLPKRLDELGVGKIDESIDVLRELEILVDGEMKDQYMLQIFLRDSAGLYKEPNAGPFFYEIIQRKGGRGFGGGNFRALFESIERQQMNS